MNEPSASAEYIRRELAINMPGSRSDCPSESLSAFGDVIQWIKNRSCIYLEATISISSGSDPFGNPEVFIIYTSRTRRCDGMLKQTPVSWRLEIQQCKLTAYKVWRFHAITGMSFHGAEFPGSDREGISNRAMACLL